jgi:hypothetical protein
MPTQDTSLKGAMVQAGVPPGFADDLIAKHDARYQAAALSMLQANPVAAFTDASGVPGAATINTPRGRVAFAGGASTVVVTNSLVTAASMVIVTLRSIDTALTSVLRALPTAGSFTITANAASTGTLAQADFLVVN